MLGTPEARFELIEIPPVRQSGKDSADTRPVFDTQETATLSDARVAGLRRFTGKILASKPMGYRT